VSAGRLPPQQFSGPGLYDASIGDQISLEERIRLGQVTNPGRAIPDSGRRLDDRLEDGLARLLGKTLIDHAGRRYLPGRFIGPTPIPEKALNIIRDTVDEIDFWGLAQPGSTD
jgi:hypothetical protein